MLAYADAPAAIEFLRRAFGFKERWRMAGENGTIGHAEIELDDNIVMLASVWRDGGLATPNELGAVHSQLRCAVPDVDAHWRQARAAGAIVLDEPADQEYGERVYRAVDPEGHRWIFATPLGNSAP
jgi:uncharacterized glyoxalase superfamily protein PhnB